MKHRIRAAAIIFNENDEVLLVRHVHPRDKQEWWVPPGGGVEDADEDVYQCARRETFEETGLEIELSRIIYLAEFVDSENYCLNLEIFVLVNKYRGQVTIENIYGKGLDEDFIKEARWVGREEAREITVYPEIFRDELWEDKAANFPHLKYLGRH